MLVSKKEWNMWKIKFEHGDLIDIEKVSGMDRRQLSRAITTRHMAIKTYYVLSDYYKSKKTSRKADNAKKVVSFFLPLCVLFTRHLFC